ncbi:unnamed protein product, partial [Effrenium voratum]
EADDILQVLEGEERRDAQRLIEMGFEPEKVIMAILQAEDASERFDRALTLLTEQEAASGARGSRAKVEPKATCSCGATSKGPFCGGCGRRLRGGAADTPVVLVDDDDDLLVKAWPEIFDPKTQLWVAVDVAFGDIVRHPVVEWPHRGTPMLWICAAGEGFFLRDVTPRYSPRWWEVELARGGRALQTWWSELLHRGCCEESEPESRLLLHDEAEAYDEA